MRFLSSSCWANYAHCSYLGARRLYVPYLLAGAVVSDGDFGDVMTGLITLIALLAAAFAFFIGGYFGAVGVEKRIASECATVGATMAGKTQILCGVNK